MSNTKDNKYIYDFNEGNKDMKNLLGGKGANLAEMTNLGLKIPPGFTLTTEACLIYYSNADELMEELKPSVIKHLKTLEINTGKKFGDERNPLLVSVRSGGQPPP